MIKDTKNTQLTPNDSENIKNKAVIGKDIYNFPPTADAPAMQIEASSAGEAEEIYNTKLAASKTK